MNENTIKQYLERLEKEGHHDKELIDLLDASYESKEDGAVTAEKILAVIEDRYVKNQGHKG